MRLVLLASASALVFATACGGPAAPATSPAAAGSAAPAPSESAAPAASSATPAPAAAPAAPASKELTVNGKSGTDADAFDIKAAVEKAGWKSEGFLYGGTVGKLQQYGVAASKDGKKVAIGFTRNAKTPEPVPPIAKDYDRKTLYKLAAPSKDAPLAHSFDDDKHEVFFWVALDKGASATDAKALFDAVFTSK